MSNAIAPAAPAAMTFNNLTREQVDLVKRTVAKGASDDELALFVHVANKAGLDPFARQVYAIKRGGAMTIQTGIDGFRLIAARTGLHAGTDEAVFEEDENGRPIKASVTVWKMVGGQRVPFAASARMSEYNAGQGLWTKMPFAMLSKCAEALALRKAFPADLSGLYTAEEMDQADARPAAPAKVAVDPERAAIEARLKGAAADPISGDAVRGIIEKMGHKGKKPSALTMDELVALDEAVAGLFAAEGQSS